MRKVLVIDKNKKPLMPCKESRARRLLNSGKAKVYRMQPFTIILQFREGGDVQETELKLDPGSKTTGISTVSKFKSGRTVTWASNLEHRGYIIKQNLDSRRANRRNRRARNTRYLKAKASKRPGLKEVFKICPELGTFE